jgi:hypothetical protein
MKISEIMIHLMNLNVDELSSVSVSMFGILDVLFPIFIALITLNFGIKVFSHVTNSMDIEFPSFDFLEDFFERKSKKKPKADALKCVTGFDFPLIEQKPDKPVDFVCCEHCAGLNEKSADLCSYCDMEFGGVAV